MRRRNFFLLLTIFLFLGLINFIFASPNSFFKNASNPLYSGASFDNWNETSIYQPSVLFDGIFKLWYGSYNGQTLKIGYATSSDGIHWASNGPIYTEPNRSSHNPSIIRDNDGKYLLAYTSSIDGQSNFRIKTLTSDTGTNFDLNTLSTINPINEWEQGDMSAPLLWKENNRYYLIYAGRNINSWQMGLAYSDNFIDWTHCSSPMFDNAGDSTLLKRNNQYFLYYHTSDALNIVLRTSPDPLSCNMTWSQPETILSLGNSYDSNHMIAPSVIEKDGILYMYYSGQNNQGKWTLNLATDQPIPAITPTSVPSPTPTAIPTATPTPTPTPISKIIVIPGLFGSWNKNAMLHQQSAPQSDWRLMPIFHDIDGLLTTLTHLGYAPQQDLFTFAYDWRQPIDTSVDQLKTFIDNHITSPNDTFKIVGHSLGGIVGRLYAQKYPSNRLKKIITVGSPHEGTANAYKAVESGEIARNDTQFYLGEQSILQLYKTNLLQSDRDVVNANLPVLKDLLPTFPYLKKTDQTFIPIDSMTVKNQLLPSYNTTLNSLFPILHTIAGTNIQTLFGYNIIPPTQLDTLLNRYPDGRPTSVINDSGDGLVLDESVSKGNNPTQFDHYTHGDILARKAAIKDMLDYLEITYVNDDDITAGDQTPTSPALLFFIQSPATMQVIFNNQTYQEDDGILYVPNAQSGIYQLRVIGTAQGDYTVTIGEIGQYNDYWTKITGKITKDPPTSQTDIYPISFNATSPQPTQTDQATLLQLLFKSLDDISLQNSSQKIFINGIKSKIQSTIKQKDQTLLRSQMIGIHTQLITQALKTSGQTLSAYLKTIDIFERYFASLFSTSTISTSTLNQQFTLADQSLQKTQKKSLTAEKKQLLNMTVDKIALATQFKTTQLNYAYILLQTAQKILNGL